MVVVVSGCRVSGGGDEGVSGGCGWGNKWWWLLGVSGGGNEGVNGGGLG